jgi:hypothetical protein
MWRVSAAVEISRRQQQQQPATPAMPLPLTQTDLKTLIWMMNYTALSFAASLNHASIHLSNGKDSLI